MTNCGFSASSVVSMSRRLVSVANCTGADASPSRWARMRTCALASSPETYRVFRPARAKCAAACSNSVDFPMPGSPPTRIAEAGTNPPPSTRSNSATPLQVRGGGASVLLRSLSTIDLPRLAPRDFLAGPVDNPLSSEMVFHALQASHWPAHLVETAPQAAQEKDFCFAMTPYCPSAAVPSNGSKLKRPKYTQSTDKGPMRFRPCQCQCL